MSCKFDRFEKPRSFKRSARTLTGTIYWKWAVLVFLGSRNHLHWCRGLLAFLCVKITNNCWMPKVKYYIWPITVINVLNKIYQITLKICATGPSRGKIPQSQAKPRLDVFLHLFRSTFHPFLYPFKQFQVKLLSKRQKENCTRYFSTKLKNLNWKCTFFFHKPENYSRSALSWTSAISSWNSFLLAGILTYNTLTYLELPLFENLLVSLACSSSAEVYCSKSVLQNNRLEPFHCNKPRPHS